MKKSKKIILRILPVLLVLVLVITPNVFAADAITAGVPQGGSQISNITNLGGSIWSTIQVIVQIAAIAAIVFAGVRYMFASADDKANIKKQTVILIVGAALVFAAVPIAKFIQSTANDVFKTAK